MIKKIIFSIVKIFRLIETSLLIFFLSLIIFISALQIILRNFFTAVDWFDSLLKYSVLWLGMIAASIATYEGKHIKIDLIGRFTKGKTKQIVLVITNLFACFVCFILFVGFVIYISKIEFTSTDAPPFLNIPRWILLLILPISFFTMSIRFLILSIKKIRDIILNIPEKIEEELPLVNDKEQQ